MSWDGVCMGGISQLSQGGVVVVVGGGAALSGSGGGVRVPPYIVAWSIYVVRATAYDKFSYAVRSDVFSFIVAGRPNSCSSF